MKARIFHNGDGPASSSRPRSVILVFTSMNYCISGYTPARFAGLMSAWI